MNMRNAESVTLMPIANTNDKSARMFVIGNKVKEYDVSASERIWYIFLLVYILSSFTDISWIQF